MVTLSEISKATAAKPRTVQLWADAGVIVAEPGTDREGSGKHREFSKGEAVIACIVAPFAADKMAIGGLRGIAWVVRDGGVNTKPFDNAINGIGNNFLVISMAHFGRVKVTSYSGPLTHMVRIIEGDSSNQQLAQFMADTTKDFPMVRILSLNSVLKPIKAMKF